MQERILGSEDSVSSFIREMGELLESHEISTNPGAIFYFFQNEILFFSILI